MGAKELYDAGNLAGAIQQLIEDVKSSPRDLRSRIFLFELLCFSGDFDKANRQLDTIAQLSDNSLVEVGIRTYRDAIAAEKARDAFFSKGAGYPNFLLEAPTYVAGYLDVIAKYRENKIPELERALAECANRVRPCKGTVDGNTFDHLRESDDLLGPFLEIIYQKDYAWFPFEQIKSIEIQSPRTLRDLIWVPAKVELGSQVINVLVPGMYYGSSGHPNELIRLGRMTDWVSLGGQFFLGRGQRMLVIDEEERSFLQLRRIEFADAA